MKIFFVIFFISILLIWLSNLLSRVRAEYSTAIKNKNTLIEEATSIKNALDTKGMESLSEFEIECYNTALSRLKTLNSYKKNHAPDNYPFLKDWPDEYQCITKANQSTC
ncbi:hypothetical protein ACV8DN_002892 [Morganella morganii]|uniref:Uncharacterized protein n=1 Tax=Morganella morganii TaxID=582 RepID=A0AAU8ZNU7_MORMO|nr:hypothetical protein [Morganella morganii]AWC94469.1 hypothetical protein AM380_12825 [Morganella morganii]